VIINTARGESSAIEEALTQVEDMRREPQSYVTDRALRIFAAAARNTPVEPVDPTSAELFGRERRLEKLPRDAAVAELCEPSPELKLYCEHVLRQEEKQYEKAGWRRSMSVERDIERKVDRLVGPESDVHEPLLPQKAARRQRASARGVRAVPPVRIESEVPTTTGSSRSSLPPSSSSVFLSASDPSRPAPDQTTPFTQRTDRPVAERRVPKLCRRS
jgi:hypothetical protein